MKKKQNPNSDYSLAHVLYQKLGTDWYAFTEVDGDCFMTKVEAEMAEAHLQARGLLAADAQDNAQSDTQSTRRRRAA